MRKISRLLLYIILIVSMFWLPKAVAQGVDDALKVGAIAPYTTYNFFIGGALGNRSDGINADITLHHQSLIRWDKLSADAGIGFEKERWFTLLPLLTSALKIAKKHKLLKFRSL